MRSVLFDRKRSERPSDGSCCIEVGEPFSVASFPVILRKSSTEKISISFRSMAPLAAFFLFALASLARAQVPVQTSTQAPPPPPDNGFYCLREPAAAGNVKAQFARGNYYLRALYVILDYAQALT